MRFACSVGVIFVQTQLQPLVAEDPERDPSIRIEGVALASNELN